MPDTLELPKAVIEALTETEASDCAEAQRLEAARMGELLERALEFEATQPSASAKARLIEGVAVAPLRYAPFFGRLAELFDHDEAEVEQNMRRLRDTGSWSKTGLLGVSRIELSPGPALASASCGFVRFAPGTHFPRHRHLGLERIFVLEGSYSDDAGMRHGPGSLHEMQVDTEHEFWVSETEACVAASVLERGLRFTRFPSRIFNLFMKR